MVKNMKFLDKAKIRIISGHGGNGMVAWRREKYVDKGGPAGGDGGRGGDIYFVADENMSTLLDFKLKSVFKAPSGENGGIKGMHGACAKDLYIKVPLGTVVKDSKTGKIIADLTENEQTVLVAKGGRGGRGNARFATAQKRAPQFCEPGEPGIERVLELELKLIADIGLLGMPNAGKSTFISAVSSARPKIADYPFTTLVPHLGVVKKADGGSYVLADIPGLIEGASEGIGLGHEFLRHIERTKVIIHIVDAAGTEGRDPVEDIKTINAELEAYNPELLSRPQIIAANKIDAIYTGDGSEDPVQRLKDEFEPQGIEVYPISAVTGKGVKELLYKVKKMLDSLDKEPVVFEREYFPEEMYDKEASLNVYKETNHVFVVEGEKIDRMLGYTNLDDEKGFAFFQRFLKENGIIDQLTAMGIEEGDTVRLGEYMEFDFYF